MDIPADADQAYQFFLDDAGRRLDRWIEAAVCYGMFASLLYCKLLSPGGEHFWLWMRPPALWLIVFLPLFVLDWLNLRHFLYMLRNRNWFPRQEPHRYLLICMSECVYRVLLCVYLGEKHSDSVRKVLTLRVVMLPYVVGYSLHFFLGNLAATDGSPRAEGCNAISALVAELGRFLQFVLIVSLSLKVDQLNDLYYTWRAAFWPCWGLEGILILLLALLIPVCIFTWLVDRARLLMLCWIIATAMGLGAATFISMYNITNLLDGKDCRGPPPWPMGKSEECRKLLNFSLWPWLIYLSAFAFVTALTKRKLTFALHTAWYQRPRETSGAQASLIPDSAPLPAPQIMFRVTPTFYRRTWEPSPSLLHREMNGGGSTASRSESSIRGLDESMSYLEAFVDRSFADIVESKNLCYVCYEARPQTVLLECGHAGLCSPCAEQLRRPRGSEGHVSREATCPICRAQIVTVMRLRPDLPVPSSLFVPQGCAVDAERADDGPPFPHSSSRYAVVVESINRAHHIGHGLLRRILRRSV